MRVLLIEDEQRLARLMRRVLEEERYTVDVADDGINGEDMARSGQYDAVVLDLMLPGRDGISVCQRLRLDGVAVPILMLTARDAVDDRVRGLDVGADDYLVKPFAFRELLARLRSLIRRRTGDLMSPLLEANGLVMDILRHQVTRDGKPIDLTAREYALLEYLLRHPGQVMTRTQLLNAVWEYDADTASNVVDIYIHYLRDKIDRNYSPKLLHTIRGVGYVLREE